VPLCARRWPAGTVVLAGCYERDALVKLDDRPATSAGSTTILEMGGVDPFDGPASGLGGGCLLGEDRADLKVSTPR
jgi:hypothetical protein